MTHEELYESKSQMKRIAILKAAEKQMTHEELLAKVNKDIEDDEWYDKTAVFNFHIYAKALRAVVELHKPAKNNEDMEDEYPENDGIGCRGCGYDYDYMMWSVAYPCPTIQAIEKELG